MGNLNGVTKTFDLLDKCHIYFLIEDGAIVYVGKSNNLGARISQHKKEKHFDSVRYLEVNKEDQDDLEIALIKTIRPPLNLQSKTLKEVTENEKSLIARYTIHEEILRAAVLSQPHPQRDQYGYVGYFDGQEVKIGYLDGEDDFNDEHRSDCKYLNALNSLGKVSDQLDEALLEYCQCEPDVIVYFGKWSDGYNLIPRIELHDIDGDNFAPLRKQFDEVFLSDFENPEEFKKLAGI